MTALFAACIFLGAALLFLVEPMAVKQVLPTLGGSPSVWNTAMVFFQAALLAGYGAAHAIGRTGRTVGVTLGLLLLGAGALFLPISLIPIVGRTPDHPVGWLLGALCGGVGVPFLALAAAGPLLQMWYSAARLRRSADPYFLYAASNAGSMAGLLAYPLLIEPTLAISEQSRLWAGGYAALLAGAGVCALCASRSRIAGKIAGLATPLEIRPVGWATHARWTVLAAIPSSLMLGVTQHISTDIAAAPFLWVIPLAIYLGTFIAAFSAIGPRAGRAAADVLAVCTVAVALTMLMEVKTPMALLVALHLVLLGSACMMCHARLAAIRPDAFRLTEFYLFIGLGGVAGGAVTSLAAPVLFTQVLEYPIAIAAVCFVRPGRSGAPAGSAPDGTAANSGGRIAGLGAREMLGAAAVACLTWLCLPTIAPGPGRTIAAVLLPALGIGALVMMRSRVPFAVAAIALLLLGQLAPGLRESTLHSERTFFGVHRVAVDRAHSLRALYHGVTLHGMQSTDPRRKSEPLTYYTPSSPLNRLIGSLNDSNRLRSIAVVGLGAGTLAAFGRHGQHIDFYEIDPAVGRIASDPSLFTYLAQCAAETRVVLGDGRLGLARATTDYDLIILDAFSSDAVPVHLLTTEALAVYIARLAPGGLIVFNISSRYFDLAPVVAAVANAHGLLAAFASDEIVPASEQALGKRASRWALVARNPQDLAVALRDPIWNNPAPARIPPWTDNYSNIVGALRWTAGPAAAPGPLSSVHGSP